MKIFTTYLNLNVAEFQLSIANKDEVSRHKKGVTWYKYVRDEVNVVL